MLNTIIIVVLTWLGSSLGFLHSIIRFISRDKNIPKKISSNQNKQIRVLLGVPAVACSFLPLSYHFLGTTKTIIMIIMYKINTSKGMIRDWKRNNGGWVSFSILNSPSVFISSLIRIWKMNFKWCQILNHHFLQKWFKIW